MQFLEPGSVCLLLLALVKCCRFALCAGPHYPLYHASYYSYFLAHVSIILVYDNVNA